MTKKIKYAVHVILFVGLLSCFKNLPVWAFASGKSDNYIATRANADYAEPVSYTHLDVYKRQVYQPVMEQFKRRQ